MYFIIIIRYNLNIDNNSFKFYPNPAQNTLQIEYQDIIQKDIWYKIIDLTGKTVQQGKLTDNYIDISNLNKGVYIINFNMEGKEIFLNKLQIIF